MHRVIDTCRHSQCALVINQLSDFAIVEENTDGREAHHRFDVAAGIEVWIQKIDKHSRSDSQQNGEREQHGQSLLRLAGLGAKRWSRRLEHVHRSGRTALKLEVADAIINGVVAQLQPFYIGLDLVRSLELRRCRCGRSGLLLQIVQEPGFDCRGPVHLGMQLFFEASSSPGAQARLHLLEFGFGLSELLFSLFPERIVGSQPCKCTQQFTSLLAQ
jgi:hypothetical protein